MSAFAKPPTPNKNRTTIRQATSTETKTLTNNCVSSSSVNHGSSTKVLEEINLLLHMETIKRNRHNEVILRQKIEEAYKLFEERRYKYFSLISKYTTLVKLAYTRKVLQCNNLGGLATESSCIDAKNVVEKLSSGSATDYICSTKLENLKKMLHDMEKYKSLPIRRSELIDLQNVTDAIQYSIEAIEMSLEKCTVQGLEHLTDSLDMINYPKILNEIEKKEY